MSDIRTSAFGALALCFAFALSACGGGGGSGGSSGGAQPPAAPNNPEPPDEPGQEAPFGLTVRQPLAMLNLPSEAAAPADFQLEVAYPHLMFDSPLFVTAVPGENRLAVLEQGGRMLAFTDDPATTRTRDILDLRSRVLFAGEQGLLGLAFHPRFEQNRYFYVHYSVDDPRRSVIARFTWDATSDVATLASEKIVLQVAQPFGNHNGGMLAFGPDDYLYIAFGDGGSGGDPQNNAQNTGNLLGTVLRLDVDVEGSQPPYAIPPDNPLVNTAGARPEIYAWGLRNPFRFSFDRQTGDLWVGDVGQGSREEIDIIEAGGNYGWRVFEGTLPYQDADNNLPSSAFIAPVYEYGRDLGVSVIGGYVYRGQQHPGLSGRYVFTDFGSGTVWALDRDSSGVTGVSNLASVSNPTSLGETASGELLVVSRSGQLLEFINRAPDPGPRTLSQTGLFEDLADLDIATGFVPYAPVLPRHDDNLSVQRWLALPGDDRIGFDPSAPWTLPVGSIVVQQFSALPDASQPAMRRQLETRVLIRRDAAWQALSFRWREDQRDADLLAGGDSMQLTLLDAEGRQQQQDYQFPSPGQCLFCHNAGAGVILGLQTAQLNSEFDYGGVLDNQLRSLNNIALFDDAVTEPESYEVLRPPADTGASLAGRARDYLDVNCAHCHRPDGPLGLALDLRRGTSLAATGALDTLPRGDDLGIDDARIIAPGDRQRSLLWQRMNRLDGTRMPPLATHVVDDEGLALVGDWIDQLE